MTTFFTGKRCSRLFALFAAAVIAGVFLNSCSQSSCSGSSSPGAGQYQGCVWAPASYSIHGTVRGLSSWAYSGGGKLTGFALVLQNNHIERTIVEDGDFTFDITGQSSYDVTVKEQPCGYNCVVSNGSGTINGADVNNILVNCLSPVDMTDIKTDVVSLPDSGSKRYEVVKSQAVFENLYQTWYLSGVLGGEPAPTINFETRSVAALLSGIKNSGGYSVKVNDIAEGSGHMTINIETKIPGSHCPVNGAMTQPFSFVSYPKSDKEVLFRESVVVAHCDGTLEEVPADQEYRTLETMETTVDINETKRFEVIRDARRFAEVYDSNGVPLPEVDFTKEVVVALFGGVHSSTAYSIRATGIKAFARHMVVNVLTSVRDESCPSDAGSTIAPRSFIAIPDRSKEIIFREWGETVHCGI